MTSLIEDAKARREALNIERSYIVQAPAGSGKTELLIQRYLKLLAHVQKPEQILAMTFTRKAAGEMKNRVLQSLDRACDPKPPKEAHERTTWEIARLALKNNDAQGWRLLENPQRCKIQTIDSFCASLTKQTPVLSGMGSLLEVEEDSRNLYRQTAHEVLARVEENSKAGVAVRSILKRLDNSKSRFLDRMVRLTDRTGSLLENIWQAISRGFKRMITKMVLDWVFGLSGIRNAVSGGAGAQAGSGGGILGGLLGGVFGGGVAVSARTPPFISSAFPTSGGAFPGIGAGAAQRRGPGRDDRVGGARAPGIYDHHRRLHSICRRRWRAPGRADATGCRVDT